MKCMLIIIQLTLYMLTEAFRVKLKSAAMHAMMRVGKLELIIVPCPNEYIV